MPARANGARAGAELDNLTSKSFEKMGYQAGAKIDNMASDLNEAMRLRGGPTPEEHFKELYHDTASLVGHTYDYAWSWVPFTKSIIRDAEYTATHTSMADAVNAVSREMNDARRKIDSFGSTLYHMDLATLSKETQMQLHHFQSVLHHSDLAALPETIRNQAQHYENMMRNSDVSAISDEMRREMDSFFSRMMGDHMPAEARRKVEANKSLFQHTDLSKLSKEMQDKMHHARRTMATCDASKLSKKDQARMSEYRDIVSTQDMAAMPQEMLAEMDAFMTKVSNDMKIEELKATLQEINVIDLVRNDKGNEKRDRYMDLQRSLKRPDAFESLSDEMVRDIRTFAKRFPHDHLKHTGSKRSPPSNKAPTLGSLINETRGLVGKFLNTAVYYIKVAEEKGEEAMEDASGKLSHAADRTRHDADAEAHKLKKHNKRERSSSLTTTARNATAWALELTSEILSFGLDKTHEIQRDGYRAMMPNMPDARLKGQMHFGSVGANVDMGVGNAGNRVKGGKGQAGVHVDGHVGGNGMQADAHAGLQ